MRALKVAIAAGAILAAAAVQAAVLDDFSTDSSANYAVFNPYNALGSFNVYAGRFDPYVSSDSTNVFIRKDVTMLAAGGDSVSIDILSLGGSASNVWTQGGLGFNSSPDNSTAFTGFAIMVANENNTYKLNGVTLDGMTLSTPATLTVTRRLSDATWYDYTVSGGGLGSSFTGSVQNAASAGKDMYFGMAIYGGWNATWHPVSGGNWTPQFVQDNLSFTSVPEPASMGVLAGVGMLMLSRRRNSAE